MLDPSKVVPEDNWYEIELNGGTFKVLENLYYALDRISRSDSLHGQYIWIDAICISQSDLVERALQVELILKIYASAQKLVIWLGPGDEHVEPAGKLVHHLNLLDEDSRRAILPESLSNPDVERILVSEYHKVEYWTALARLFCRAWFRRAWVVQEVLLSEQSIVLCGEHEFAWQDLVTVSGFLANSPWYNVFAKPTFFAAETKIDGTRTYDKHRMRPHLNGPAKLKAAKKTLRGKAAEDDMLLLSLIRSRRYTCSDQRDKAFSLYGLAKKFANHPERVGSRVITSLRNYLLIVETVHLHADSTLPTRHRSTQG
ncbi:MAG: hypothetical protein M1820_005451 [Bogoriella megaspora]|nr:MAG: hypothetical protein M1820_005451 [Bogoriella megaspora]